MDARRWNSVRLGAGAVLVAAAAAGVAAGLTWVPVAVVGAFFVLVLLGEPPQGATEWVVVLGFVAAVAIAGVVLTSGDR